MVKKKRYPKIHPSIVKDQTGKPVEIYLTYQVYESIIEEIDELAKQLSGLKKKKKAKTSKS